MRERKREGEIKRVCKKDLKPLRQTSPEPPAAVRHVSRGRDFLALLGAKHGLECVFSLLYAYAIVEVVLGKWRKPEASLETSPSLMKFLFSISHVP